MPVRAMPESVSLQRARSRVKSVVPKPGGSDSSGSGSGAGSSTMGARLTAGLVITPRRAPTMMAVVTELSEAVRAGDAQTVDDLLAREPKLASARTPDGGSLVLLACIAGHGR